MMKDLFVCLTVMLIASAAPAGTVAIASIGAANPSISAAAVSQALGRQLAIAMPLAASPADLADSLMANAYGPSVAPAECAAAGLLVRALTDKQASPLIERWLARVEVPGHPDFGRQVGADLARLSGSYQGDPVRRAAFLRSVEPLRVVAAGSLDELKSSLDAIYTESRASGVSTVDARAATFSSPSKIVLALAKPTPRAKLPVPSVDAHARKAFYRQDHFDREQGKDFPNLFLPRRLRGLTQQSASPELQAALLESRRATEKALGAIFDRLVVPLYRTGQSEPQAARFFALAGKIAREIDSGARVVPSGGVVRSALGLLYEEMLRASEKNPETFNELDFLAEVAQGRHPMFDKNGNIMAFDVRGVGSDFDLLLDAKSEKFDEIDKAIKALFVDPTAKALSKSDDPNDMNKAFFTIADLKPLVEQTARSVRQGGAATDLLVFDLEKGVLVEPSNVPGIVDDFLQGYYRYLPPLAGARREDPVSTTLRGPRALVELPFLRLRSGDQERLNEELRKIRRDIEDGIYPNEKAIAQINKLRRNGRLSMANNAVIRAPANTTLGLVRSIAHALEDKRQAQLLKFPTEIRFDSYTPRYPLGTTRARMAERLPSSLRRHLINRDDFLREFTDDGALYHGTSGQGALGILRGGFRQTDYEGALRRGTYSTKDAAVAQAYSRVAAVSESVSVANGGSYMLKLPLKKGATLVAFDARPLDRSDRMAYARLGAEAKANNMELSDWLARNYGIDFIIVSDAALIKNAEALERVTLPSLARDAVAYLNREIDLEDPDFGRLLIERKRLEAAKPLFKALDIETGRVPTEEEILQRAISALPRLKDPMTILEIYNALPSPLREKQPEDAFGGKSLPQVFADALVSDPELANVFRGGYGNFRYGFNKVVASAEWPRLLKKAIADIRDKISSPALSPQQRFVWLFNLQRILLDIKGIAGLYGENEVTALVQSIPESAYKTIRTAAAQRPTDFDGIPGVEQELTQLGGKKVDLTSASISKRLKQIETSKNVPDKLTDIQLLSWATDLTFHAGDFPEIVAAVRKVIPLIREDEDIFHGGTALIISMIHSNSVFEKDLEQRQLLERSLRAVLKNVPDRQTLHMRRDEDRILGLVASVVVDAPNVASPELISLLKLAHERYRLDQEMPGYWPELEKIFAQPVAK